MLAAGFPVVLAVSFHLYQKYLQEYQHAEDAVLVTVQAIAYQHGSQVEGIRNLLIALSNYPEIRKKDSKACTAIIKNILRQSPSNLNIGIADPDGKLIASGVSGNFSIGDRKYFQDALRTKRFSAGEFTISRAYGKPAIHFGLPVLDKAGNPVVVIYATFNLNQFKAMFDAQKLPKNSVLNMTDHKGTILFRYPELKSITPGQPDNPTLRRHLTGPNEEGVFIGVGLDGLRRQIAFKRLRLYPEDPPYLYIRATIPEDAALEGVRKYLIISITMFVLAIIITMVATRFLTARFLVMPVERLANVAGSITNGNLSIRTGLPYANDELGLLAQSFDTMAATLKSQLGERDRAEALLKASEDKFRTIFNHLNDAIFIHDMETKRIIDVNQAMCTLYGYSREEACQLDVSTLSQGQHPYTEKKALERMALASAGQPQIYEWVGKHRDGHLLWTEVSMRLATIDGIDRLIVLVRDIRERKEAEAEKKSLTDQLNQAQRIESIGRLAGGIAHDFNNLLTPIIGYAELVLRETADNPSAMTKVERIMQAAFRARELTQQLLSFGRKQILNMRSIDLNRLINSFSEILKRTIRENVEIHLKLAPELKSIRADRTQLEQILMNLVINAQDAIKGIGSITIETAMVTLDESYTRNHSDARPGLHTMLAVSDDGCGINAENLKHIFEPFFTTKGIGEGSGLGLATVHGIVKQHGGSIWIYSEEERGTIFKLFFPSISAVAEQDAVLIEAAQPLERAHGRILLVEDNLSVREMLKELLLSRGYAVIEAGNPLEALALTEDLALDLLITDVIMPDMNGPELYSRLTQRQPGLKVIFMSGYTDNIIKEHGDLDKDASFIQKPFTIAAIERKIAEVMPPNNIPPNQPAAPHIFS